ncbi:ABC transporter permease [Macrococcoides goetzii]|nr:ABC transporter permease [Macrococcus goetzii]TDM45542.1 ABC transporter permease [Macrococcus goetzii]TDM48601.1 ABC transporter permease [Macrococcus goetzii]
MKLQLFSIYHSFLMKKWYLLVYILVLFFVLFATLIGFSVMKSQEDDKFSIGLVDEDQSRETKLILDAIGNGKSMGNDIELKQFEATKANNELKQHHLDGYFVFDQGMTEAFYKQGALPISVYTYDKTSLESIIIYQLTDSVYSRLMLSIGGAGAYKALYPESSDDAMLMMMTDMLFTGLNRNGAFDEQPVKLYDNYQYYTISVYFISVYVLFLSLFNILKMNQAHALKERLSMFHFSYEKLTLTRGLISLWYTLLFSAVVLYVLLKYLDVSFESYNLMPLLIILFLYLIMIFVVMMLIELVNNESFQLILKVMITGLIILFSGATIPSIYFKDVLGSILYHQPFSHIFNKVLELILNNYFIKTPILFYWICIILISLLILQLIWRYRR